MVVSDCFEEEFSTHKKYKDLKEQPSIKYIEEGGKKVSKYWNYQFSKYKVLFVKYKNYFRRNQSEKTTLEKHP